MSTGCMELIPNGPGSFYWCELAVDDRSDPATPRCTEHLTAETTRRPASTEG